MLRPLVTILLLTLLSGVTLGGDNTPGAVVRYKTEGDYDMVRESLKIAITGQRAADQWNPACSGDAGLDII